MTIPDLPSLAIALLHELDTHAAIPCFNLKPEKLGGQLTTPMVSFSNVLFAKLFDLKILSALIMSSSHSPHNNHGLQPPLPQNFPPIASF